MKNTCYFTLYLLLPLSVENILQLYQNTGNMALHGVFTDIYNKRNIFYFSLILLLIEYINNHTLYSSLFVILSLINFINCCNKWVVFIK
jgi:hypothetical protein